MSFNLSSSYNTAAANTDVVVTLSAPSVQVRRSLKQITWSLTATPAAAIPLNIESPSGTVLFSVDITTGGPGFIDFGSKGLPGANASAVIVTLDLASNSNTTGKLTVIHDIE